ncbi:uncharacterized protein LOC122644729 [Telopea speciosissima]|uniref:uncharacterized protein LOC122644729 n=1 Tax=Telopea speciosissima TaxID=54955 RepID=UPI001CC77935|nr:uncharacterized protein LOC122644729 [Telopea speciosissima]
MWARHTFDNIARSDHITNNMSESFNNWITDLRNKPILILVDELRSKLMDRFYKMYAKGCTYDDTVTPKARRKLNKVQQESRSFWVLLADDFQCEVTDNFASRCVVNLKDRTCCCKVWESTGMPCKHAVAAILHKRELLETYCDAYYNMQKYMASYSRFIAPIPTLDGLREYVMNYVVQPPHLKRMPGRPHVNRRREQDEAPAAEFRKMSRTVRCDNCKQLGHNKRRCERASSRTQAVVQAQNYQDSSNISSIIDRKMGSSFTTEGMKEFIQLTVHCMEFSSERRTTMNHVVAELDQILEREMS